jgi:6-phosphofructokinase 1
MLGKGVEAVIGTCPPGGLGRIGVLTSGGDAPGMNAAVAGVARQADRVGCAPIAIRRGFAGLAAREAGPLDVARAEKLRCTPGTWLGTSRWPALQSDDGRHVCLQAIRALELDALVVIGGNGSAQGARALTATVPVTFVPATIDRDIAGTDMAIGTDSAVAYAVAVIEKLRITGASLPGRAFVVQTLGAPTGYLADAVARAVGVPDAIVPERPRNLSAVAARLRNDADTGVAIAIMSEAVGDAVRLGEALGRLAGIRVHPTILGHAQRAAEPSTIDLRAGRVAGEAAVDMVVAGQSGFIAMSSTGDIARRRFTPRGETQALAHASPDERQFE